MEHALRGRHRGHFRQRQRHEPPLGRQEFQQVDEFLRLQLLLKALGHDRFSRNAQLFDILSLHSMNLCLGIDQFDRRLRFAS